jgi:16S rRNA (guanine527-N7)-methyltransferase
LNAEQDFSELLAPHVDGDARRRLVLYAELLEKWAPRHNLVRYADRRELVERHLVESLEGRRFIASPGRLMDVGSGAGLPGIPLLASIPGLSGVLLEPREKRWVFLRRVIRELELDVEVLRSRYQDLPDSESGFDVVTCRAVGGMVELAGWAVSRVVAGGRLLLWTTDEGLAEVEKLPRWRVLSCKLPSLERGRLAVMQPCFT